MCFILDFNCLDCLDFRNKDYYYNIFTPNAQFGISILRIIRILYRAKMLHGTG